MSTRSRITGPRTRRRSERTCSRSRERVGTGRLLDVGCGAGFVIGLMRDVFDEIHGIDPTKAMLDRVDTSSGNITLHEGVAEELPFEDSSFDLVTAYSVLHHLADHRPVLAEVARVLRPGGVFYVDLEPNRAFWRAIEDLARRTDDPADLDEIVRRELRAVLHVAEDVSERFAIAPETFRSAEHIKSELGGFDADEFTRDARAAGFRSCASEYEWFLGQGVLIHGPSPEDAGVVERHLRRLLPLTASLFKYLRFEAAR